MSRPRWMRWLRWLIPTLGNSGHMQIIKGIPAAKGIAIGPGFHHQLVRLAAPERVHIRDAAAEIERLDAAILRSEAELDEVYQAALKKLRNEDIRL